MGLGFGVAALLGCITEADELVGDEAVDALDDDQLTRRERARDEGAIAFGVFYLELAMHDFSVIAGNALLLWLPVVFSGLFVVLAWRYWFIYPLVGITMGFASFVLGVGFV